MLPITLFPRRFVTACKQKRGLTILQPLLSSKRYFSIRSHSTLPEVVSTTETFSVPRSADWYTSDRNPWEHNVPGYMKDNALTSLKVPNLATITRQEALDYLDNVWALTDELFAALQNEEAFLRAPYHGLRHPMIFYYGHVSAFYINKLRLAGVLSEGLNEYYEEIFEVGVDEMSWDDMSKNEMEWPALADVKAYRREVYQILKDIISTHQELQEDHAPIDANSQLWSLFMGFEHDHIHLETSSVLLRELPLKYLEKPQYWANYAPIVQNKPGNPIEGVDYPKMEWIEMPGGQVTLGKPNDFPTFGWDNEYGSKTLNVLPFKATKHLITNGEYWQFVNDGGYHKAEHWSEEGWSWRGFRNIKWPTFWVKYGPSGLNQYRLRLLFDEVDMQWDWPVEVNHHEAQAYCHWKAKKDNADYHLTTEAIHHLIRGNTSDEPILAKPNQPIERMSESDGMNLNISYASPTPVTKFPPNVHGFHDVQGNVWELSEDRFNPLPGFQVHDYYHDFSSPCFDGEHNMIMGGSFSSCGDNGASIHARYHFRKHFHQFSGIRLISPLQPGTEPEMSCRTASGPFVQFNRDLSDSNTATSLASGYGETTGTFQSVYDATRSKQRMTTFIQQHIPQGPLKVAQLNCKVGSLLFELRNTMNDLECIGIDENIPYIEAAKTLLKNGTIQYTINGESKTISLNPSSTTSTLSFVSELTPDTKYDVLIAMESTQDEVMSALHDFEGILILGTPEERKKADSLLQYLSSSPEYELLSSDIVPMYSRELPSSCRVSNLYATAWRKR